MSLRTDNADERDHWCLRAQTSDADELLVLFLFGPAGYRSGWGRDWDRRALRSDLSDVGYNPCLTGEPQVGYTEDKVLVGQGSGAGIRAAGIRCDEPPFPLALHPFMM
jgi:hypothetical protein|eukprot:5548481-Prymnesium_polylepis.1